MYYYLIDDLNNLINNIREEKYIIIAKGFPLPFISKFISDSSNQISFLSEESLIYSNKKIDLYKIKKNKKELIRKLLNIDSRKYLILFEEFYSIIRTIDFSIFNFNFYIEEEINKFMGF